MNQPWHVKNNHTHDNEYAEYTPYKFDIFLALFVEQHESFNIIAHVYELLL